MGELYLDNKMYDVAIEVFEDALDSKHPLFVAMEKVEMETCHDDTTHERSRLKSASGISTRGASASTACGSTVY